MRPHTERVPKALLPVGGVPFLDRLLDRLAECDVDDVLLLLGHMGGLVERHLATRASPRPRVRTASEGETLLGTAGALRAAASDLDERFVVTYGDSYLPFDYRSPLERLAADPDALGCMAVYENHDRFEPSNARVAGGRVVAYDKARPTGSDFDHVDYGATALRREVVLALAPGRPLALSDVQRDLARGGRLLALVASERFYEIGSPAGLADLERHLEARRS
jgi:NDP-sugar pyrophosphorylase family protein